MTKNNPQASISHIQIVPSVEKDETSYCNDVWTKNVNIQSNVRVVNANELTSISALIAYVAHNRGETEFRVERRVADRFHVANVTRLPSSSYDEAIRYLVDSVIDLSKK